MTASRPKWQAGHFNTGTGPRKIRWRIWSWLSSRPGMCPANAYSLIIDGYRRSPAIDSMCRELANGSCWCGKLRDPDYKPEGSDR